MINPSGSFELETSKLNKSFTKPEFLSTSKTAFGSILSAGLTLTTTCDELLSPKSSVTVKVTVNEPSDVN